MATTTEERLVAVLRSDAAVTTHTGSGNPPVSSWRIYPEKLPKSPTLPAITYARVYGANSQSFDGIDNLMHARVQIDCWGETLAAAKALASAVKAAVNGANASLGPHLHGETYDFEEAARNAYRVMLDYAFWFDES